MYSDRTSSPKYLLQLRFGNIIIVSFFLSDVNVPWLYNDGNAIAILSFLSRIWGHILRAITKFSSSNVVAGLKLHISSWSNDDGSYWQVMTMLYYHRHLEDLDSCTTSHHKVHSQQPQLHVAWMTLPRLFFLERCRCSSIVYKDDGDAIAMPSHLSRIWWHILCVIKKFNINDVDCLAEASSLQLERCQCS